MSKENEIRTNSNLIKCVVKLLGSRGTKLALVLFKSTYNLNENIIEDTFWRNGRWPEFHTFLFYIWLAINAVRLVNEWILVVVPSLQFGLISVSTRTWWRIGSRLKHLNTSCPSFSVCLSVFQFLLLSWTERITKARNWLQRKNKQENDILISLTIWGNYFGISHIDHFIRKPY